MADTSKKDASASLPDRLAPDPKNPPDLTLLQGWLGASSESGHRRLYLDPELSNSVEIPEDAIVHTQDVPKDSSPLGGEWVWIKAEANVKQGPGLERQYARFLRGQIQQDYFAAGGGAAGGGMVGAPPPTSPIVCQPIRTLVNCPTRTISCRPSVVTICASSPIICRPSLGIACIPSVAVMCPTRGYCPSAVDACPSAPGGCDPWTIVQTGTIVQQPIDFGGVAGGGFDPGVAAGGFQNFAGGMVGAPGVAAGAAVAYPRTIIGCPSRFTLCRPSVLTICVTRPVICQQVSVAAICPTHGFCPSAVDGCPSTPGGCDPWTIYQQGTTVVQPVDVGGFAAGGGLGFDPGVAAGGFADAAGGMVGAPGPGAGGLSVVVICQPIRTLYTNCPTRQFWCRPSVLTICVTQQPALCGGHPSAAVICPSRGFCPSAVDGCPSAPGGCDPWTIYQQGTTVVQPVDVGGIAGGGGFDPGIAAGGGFGGVAGGMVGGPNPAAVAVPYNTALVQCQLVTHNIIQCRPTFVLAQCRSLLTPFCPTRFCTVPPQCLTLPTLPTGCPTGPFCGGGGGGYGGGF